MAKVWFGKPYDWNEDPDPLYLTLNLEAGPPLDPAMFRAREPQDACCQLLTTVVAQPGLAGSRSDYRKPYPCKYGTAVDLPQCFAPGVAARLKAERDSLKERPPWSINYSLNSGW